jgi:ribosome-binding factor A
MAIPRHHEEDGEPLRVKRVAEAIKEEASLTITQKLADPRLGFVTVTRVKISRDLRDAVIYISILGGTGERSKTLHALADARGFIKRGVGDRLKLRFTPNLRFEFDEGIDKSIRVAELLRQASEEPPPKPLKPLEEEPGAEQK